MAILNRTIFVFLVIISFNSWANNVLIIDVDYQNGRYNIANLKERSGRVFSVPIQAKANTYDKYVLEAVNENGVRLYHTPLPRNLTIHTPLPPHGDGKAVPVKNAHYQLKFPATTKLGKATRLNLLMLDKFNSHMPSIVQSWQISELLR